MQEIRLVIAVATILGGCAAGEALQDAGGDAAPRLPVDGPPRTTMADAARMAPDAAPTVPDAAAIDAAPQGLCAGSPDGFQYASGDLYRCCGGVPVVTNTAEHCGVCDIQCGPGSDCVNVGGAWQCTCNTSDQCWSGCCSISAGTPYVCVPSSCGDPASCIACPGGATCTETTPHYYCHY
jgi:hypothetical protein